jgi:hypothetical protein
MLRRKQTDALGLNGISTTDVYEDVSTRTQQSVRIGEGAGKINSGVGNVYAGYNSGNESVNSSFSTAIGYQSMASSKNSTANTAVGATLVAL